MRPPDPSVFQRCELEEAVEPETERGTGFDLKDKKYRKWRISVRALSVRQPWAELILRGVKTVEARPRRTHKKGELAFQIYAGLQRIERHEESRIAAEFEMDIEALPRGVLVGTVEIVGCERLEPRHSQPACFEVTETMGGFAWQLRNPERADVLTKPDRQPQPSFFEPF